MFARKDPNALAALAVSQGADFAVRNDILSLLQQHHLHLALHITTLCSIHSHDIRDDLVQHVNFQLLCGRYDPSRCDYSAWCRCVMRNHLLDQIRKEKRFVQTKIDQAVDDPLILASQYVDWRSPFSASDLARVIDWELDRQRVLLLTRGLLWVKARERWAQWLRAVGIYRPFPEEGFEDWPANERHAALADALEIPLNTLHQYWKRWRPMLLQLDYVRGLRAASDGSDS